MERQERKCKRFKRREYVSGSSNKKEEMSGYVLLPILDTVQKEDGKKRRLEDNVMDISLAVVAKQPRQAP